MRSKRSATPPADIEPPGFDALLWTGRPLLDLRAPIEYARGSAPGSVNLPLLDDGARAQVGLRYREAGEVAALALGHELVGGALREARIAAWIAWCDANPDGVLCCFRGGQRSRIVQSWLAEAGRPRAVVAGGYKSLRAHMGERLASLGANVDLIVVGGRTGTGKTAVLQSLPRHIDLEGLARHRGSAFGARVDSQPALADFENLLAVHLLRLTHASRQAIAIEDEATNVGQLTVPRDLHANASRSPIAVVEMPLEERVTTTLRAYVLDACSERQSLHGEALGFDSFAGHLTGALARIRKRLGGRRYEEIAKMLADALQKHRQRGEVDAHRRWIERLLVEYYDPMYDYQLATTAARIAFRGDADAVRAWASRRVGA
ncbi:MAG TPA: tRNA 2-selenouridine(34) synthase MnmH [Planctomycetota bacterium]|nr:tRNA 2-selenouridine(34) synthase MnmH [Planctomycetota bacterium]